MGTEYDPSFEADFADGTHTFRLCGIKEWAELEEKTGSKLADVFARLRAGFGPGGVGPNDIIEPIRLSLVGGGMKAVDALALVRRYVIGRPLIESWPLALKCVSTAIFGPDDLTQKKAKRGARTAKPKTAA